LFGLLILLYCGCADRHHHKPFCEQELVDSLEVLMSPLNFTHILTQAVDELSESESYKGLFHQHKDYTDVVIDCPAVDSGISVISGK